MILAAVDTTDDAARAKAAMAALDAQRARIRTTWTIVLVAGIGATTALWAFTRKKRRR